MGGEWFEVFVIGNTVLVGVGWASALVNGCANRGRWAAVTVVFHTVLVKIIAQLGQFNWELDAGFCIVATHADADARLSGRQHVPVTGAGIQAGFGSGQHGKSSTRIDPRSQVQIHAQSNRNSYVALRRGLGLVGVVRCQLLSEHVGVCSVFGHVVDFAVAPIEVGIAFGICQIGKIRLLHVVDAQTDPRLNDLAVIVRRVQADARAKSIPLGHFVSAIGGRQSQTTPIQFSIGRAIRHDVREQGELSGIRSGGGNLNAVF